MRRKLGGGTCYLRKVSWGKKGFVFFCRRVELSMDFGKKMRNIKEGCCIQASRSIMHTLTIKIEHILGQALNRCIHSIDGILIHEREVGAVAPAPTVHLLRFI